MSPLLWVVLLFATVRCEVAFDYNRLTSKGYVNVRSDAHMFWWLYHASSLSHSGFVKQPHSETFPTIIWLQGGPGGSSTGFGNFELIGPLDSDLQIRNSSWIQYANLLFIDNPVGTGFSYVTNSNAYATNNELIATDLVELLKHFYQANPSLQSSPLYIFSESYGGKMAVTLSIFLWNAIQKNQIKCNLKGLVLGDPWISPFDSVSTWPQYLKSFSLIDETQYEDLSHKMLQMDHLLQHGQFENATKYWSYLEALIRNFTYRSNFYNVMKHDPPFLPQEEVLGENGEHEPEFYLYKLGYFFENDLETLMNTKIRSILSVIPSRVVWGEQIVDVFNNLKGDFMKPVLEDVKYILNNLPIKVVVYNGQWDLIVNVLGTSNWVNRMTFEGSDKFKASPKKVLEKDNEVLGYYKSHGKFSFYWILRSGHMVPKDASDAALKMLINILKNK